MAEVISGGTIWAESEFLPNETAYAKCGENMQAMLQSWARQAYRSTQSVYVAARAAGRCDLSGASTMAQQRAQAQADGFKVDYLPTNTGMSQATWRGFLLAHLPNQAVGIEVANGSAFRDYLTGKGEDASNLKFHFVTVFGHHDGGASPHAGGKVLPAGWWVADGDNYVNNTMNANGTHDRHLGGHTLCFYPETVMQAARPCAALAMYPKVSIPGGTHMVPAGWKDDGTTLTAPDGRKVVQGFRTFVLNWPGGWPSANWPLGAEYSSDSIEPGNPAIGAGSRQDFRWTSLGWTSAKGAYQIWTGQDLQALEKQVADLQAKLAQAGSGTTNPKAEALYNAVRDAVA